VNLQYVAGIIDGEGYVSIDRNSKSDHSLVGRVVVSMGDSTIPILLFKQFRGNYRIQKRNNPNQSDAHIWSVNGVQARKFLRKVLSFLILKKKQAELVIALYDLKDDVQVRNHPTEKDSKKQFKLYIEAKKLVTRKGRKTRKDYASYRLWKSS